MAERGPGGKPPCPVCTDRPGQPPAGVDDLGDHRLQFIFWGIKTGTLGHSFEISGSSLFTLGFAEPEGNARIWLTFVEATIGLGTGGPADQLPAHHLLRPPPAREGDHRPAPVRRHPPLPDRPARQHSTAWAPWTIPTCGGRRPAGCSSSTRPTPPFPPSATSPSRRPTSRGWRRWAACSTPPPCSCRPRTSVPATARSRRSRVRCWRWPTGCPAWSGSGCRPAFPSSRRNRCSASWPGHQRSHPR